MKRILSFLLALIVVLGMTVSASAAEIVDSGTCGDNLTWTLDHEGTLTISGKGEMWNFLTEESDDEFSNKTPWNNWSSEITSIIIQPGVTSVGDAAFSGCNSDALKDIDLPEGITRIGKYAFVECLGLETIDLPDSLISIDYFAFYNCQNLQSIVIPQNVRFIGHDAFFYCTSLESAVLPEGLERIEDFLFDTCSMLKTVNIPSTVTSIGCRAFCLTSLSSIILPDGLISIESSAFSSCQLTSIDLPNGLQSLGPGVFSGNEFSSVVIPNGVTIEDSEGMFAGCEKLEKVILPESMTHLGSNMFFGCKNLTEVNIPEGVTEIRDRAFLGCWSLREIELPAGLTSIGQEAFFRCDSLEELIVPDGVTTLGAGAFDSCGELKRVKLPASLLKLEDETFRMCIKLTDVVLPDGITSIGSSAFHDCGDLPKMNIPESVTSIGDQAFYGCNDLEEMIVPDSVTKLGTGTFSWCQGLKKVELSENLITLEDETFRSCVNLQHIVIPESVTSIGKNAFYSCYNLASIYIPKSVISIGDNAFLSCVSLMNVYFGGSAEEWAATGADCSEAKYIHYACAKAEDHWVADSKKETCTDDGYFREICNCGYIRNEKLLPATGHGYTSVVTAPTCTEQGYTTHSCYACGNSYVDNHVDALGHTGGIATCTEPAQCVRCCASYGEVDALGHVGGIATCAAPAQCDRCGVSYGEKNPELHLGGTECRAAKEATCTEEGYTGDIWCLDCNSMIEPGKIIPTAGHGYETVFTSPTCTEQGHLTNICTVCGDSYVVYYVDALGHIGGIATCAAPAQCDCCGVSYGKKNPANHVGVKKLRGKKAAICTEDGYSGDTWCLSCNSITESGEIIPAIGHNYVNGVCTRCGALSGVPAKPYKIANVVSGVHVYWKATEGAAKYGLWRSETGKDGTYKGSAKPTVHHVTDTKVESGKTYFYKVTAMNAAGVHSDKSEAIGITYVSTPDITSRTNIAAGVKLGWEKVTGATGYAIYRKSYSGTDAWVRVGTISGNSTFTWTDTSVKNNNGTIYKYTIRALAGSNMKTLSGCRNAGRTMARLSSQVMTSAAKASSTSIKCQWTTSSRVTGYEVRFMVGNTVYKTFTVGNYKTGVKTFTVLKAGQTYTIQVRTYLKVDGMGFYSDWSVAKTVKI